MLPEARKFLEDLMANAQDQLLKPEAVVDAARPRSSPLHGYFTWNNAEAADQWRLVQARALLRSVIVMNPAGLDVQPTVRYVSLLMDRSQPGGGYRAVETVLASQALREEYMHTAMTELNGWLKRHAHMRDLTARVAVAAGIAPPPRVVAAFDAAPRG